MVYELIVLKFDNIAISLRYIESMEYPAGEDQEIVDVLRDDIELKIVMIR